MSNKSVANSIYNTGSTPCQNAKLMIIVFYNDIIIKVKVRFPPADIISSKLEFTTTLENTMLKSELNDMVVKMDGRQLHHLCFARNIPLITPIIEQPKHLLAVSHSTCGKISLMLDVGRKMFMKNGYVVNAPFTLSKKNISEC
ncbi:hypothetical protein DICVIV_04807 [Dictyocaulus viviparus]|uniref:Uncharacterized protein n=1 Tax=Dictyocaulus viviparus TaxID=29172 RepID=A0A0D8XX61_DICVI|nr:hypothetical protein DICVIV_04807 [Dictyocaulus viviparus]